MSRRKSTKAVVTAIEGPVEQWIRQHLTQTGVPMEAIADKTDLPITTAALARLYKSPKRWEEKIDEGELLGWAADQETPGRPINVSGLREATFMAAALSGRLDSEETARLETQLGREAAALRNMQGRMVGVACGILQAAESLDSTIEKLLVVEEHEEGVAIAERNRPEHEAAIASVKKLIRKLTGEEA